MAARPVQIARTRRRRRMPMPGRGCDCSVCDFYIHNPQAVEPLCSGCNTDCEYCSCLKSLSGRADACDECQVVCGSRVGVAEWMHAAGGTLRFDGLQFPTVHHIEGLPRFVPVVDSASRCAELDDGLGWAAYAARLPQVISARTGQVTPAFAGRTARQVMGLADDQHPLLLAYHQDQTAELVWSERHRLGRQLAGMGWSLMVGPDLSVYGSAPRFDQLLNMRRQLLLADLFNRMGVPSAPNLFWFRLEDLERLGDLLDSTRPAYVATNQQMNRSVKDWEQLTMPGLIWLAQGLPAETTVVVTGTTTAGKIADLAGLFPRLIIVSSQPVMLARKRAIMTGKGRHNLEGPVRVSDCFAANVRYYEQLIETSIG